jgi:acyl carrier protein
MLPDYENAINVVYKVLAELNLQRSRKARIDLSPHTALFGADGALDSLALSNLIVLTEQQVQEAFGVEIDLTEGDPFGSENGPLRTVDTLASHVVNLVRQQL